MKDRLLVLVACAVAVVSILLLASSLTNLSFEPARPVGRAADVAMPSLVASLRVDEDTTVLEIVFFWLALVIPAVLVVLLLPPELRKRVLQYLIRFALFMLAVILALRYRLIKLPDVDPAELSAGQAGFQTLGDPSAEEAFIAPMIPSWVTYVISLFLIALMALGAYEVYRFWRRAHPRRSSALSAIAAVARDSLDDLAEGRQWGDVVVEAYARMTDVVRVARGVQRDASWTPREFAIRLARNGLPASAVDELTRLFEAARYGGALADATARSRAGACLESILRACRGAL